MKKIIKKTQSFSPSSLKIIPSRIIEEENGIYLEKKDENNKSYKSLIEKDKNLYFDAIKDQFNINNNYFFYILNISSKCNIDCSFCYKKDSNKEISLKELNNLIKQFKNKIFVLAGKEPTCRKELIDIIKLISKNNFVCIATNGIKLTDYIYLKKLKEAGLKHILFSLNAFEDSILEKIHGEKLLKKKLSALENIKRLNIPTIISTTIIPGINENEINKIFRFCIENHDFIYEFRIRSMTPYARHLKVKSFCLSELIKTTCSQLNIDYDNLRYEFNFINNVNKYLKLYQIKRKICSSYFHVKINNDGNYTSFGDLIADSSNNFFKKLFIFSSFSFPIVFNKINNRFKKKEPYSIPNFIRVSFRSWPNVNNIDINEINNKCTTCVYENNKKTPFCIDNIKRSFAIKR